MGVRWFENFQAVLLRIQLEPARRIDKHHMQECFHCGRAAAQQHAPFACICASRSCSWCCMQACRCWTVPALMLQPRAGSCQHWCWPLVCRCVGQHLCLLAVDCKGGNHVVCRCHVCFCHICIVAVHCCPSSSWALGCFRLSHYHRAFATSDVRYMLQLSCSCAITRRFCWTGCSTPTPTRATSWLCAGGGWAGACRAAGLWAGTYVVVKLR